jgi:hypothetical protein
MKIKFDGLECGKEKIAQRHHSDWKFSEPEDENSVRSIYRLLDQTGDYATAFREGSTQP